eukprot:133106-Amphidinium_carterae.3
MSLLAADGPEMSKRDFLTVSWVRQSTTRCRGTALPPNSATPATFCEPCPRSNSRYMILNAMSYFNSATPFRPTRRHESASCEDKTEKERNQHHTYCQRKPPHT